MAMTKTSKNGAITEEEEKVLETYRRARKDATHRPVLLTVVLVPGGPAQVWIGQPGGTIGKR